MSKEELLKYLIAEIDLIMHDKDYRFENANGTWYSRESCRDLTNEEVFEELRTELRQFADLEAKLAESEKKAYSRGHSQRDIANEIKLNALREDVANKEKRIVELKQQLAEKEKNALALFSALYDILEEQDPENVSSRIDYLTKQNNGAISDFYKEYKVLKQELEEKDKAIENWKTMYKSVVQTCYNDKEEIERLNKKLAEKEKEIEYQESMKILAVENQNKKAIEQLEKVKGLIANHTQELWTCENDDIDVVLYEEIDNQINELKGKVE